MGLVPKISLGSRGGSKLTGPWSRSRWEDEEHGYVEGREEKREVNVAVQEVRSAY